MPIINGMKSPLAFTAFLLLVLANLPLSAQRQPAPGALASAVAVGDLRETDRLIGLGADPDQPDATGQTPLCYAVDSGRVDLVERILGTTADPDRPGRDGRTPMMIAIAASRDDMLLKLLAAGADPDRISDIEEPGNVPVAASPLSVAINRGYFDTARRLFNAGADPRRLKFAGDVTDDPLNLPVLSVPADAGVWRDMGDIRDSAESPDWDAMPGLMSLHRAARDNDWRTARDNLDKGADPDSADERGVTPLMIASWHGHASMVSLFLQRGAVSAAVDNRGRTALSYAAAAGSLNCLDILLTVPSPTETPAIRLWDDIDQSPLYYALVFAHRSTLDRLVAGGIRPDGADGNGVNLLMLAAWMGDLRTVELLLPLMDGGARDGENRTALAWAAAAFDRNRRADRESGINRKGGDIYALARLLAARNRDPAVFSTQPTRDMVIDGIDAAEAWSPSVYTDENGNLRPRNDGTDILRNLNPPPVPTMPADGDLTLYRIFRDEEPGIPAAD